MAPGLATIRHITKMPWSKCRRRPGGRHNDESVEAMKLQRIRDIASDYRRTHTAWKRAYKRGMNGKLGPLEERLEIMYDDVGQALLAALKLIEPNPSNNLDKEEK